MNQNEPSVTPRPLRVPLATDRIDTMIRCVQEMDETDDEKMLLTCKWLAEAAEDVCSVSTQASVQALLKEIESGGEGIQEARDGLVDALGKEKGAPPSKLGSWLRWMSGTRRVHSHCDMEECVIVEEEIDDAVEEIRSIRSVAKPRLKACYLKEDVDSLLTRIEHLERHMTTVKISYQRVLHEKEAVSRDLKDSQSELGNLRGVDHEHKMTLDRFQELQSRHDNLESELNRLCNVHENEFLQLREECDGLTRKLSEGQGKLQEKEHAMSQAWEEVSILRNEKRKRSDVETQLKEATIRLKSIQEDHEKAHIAYQEETGTLNEKVARMTAILDKITEDTNRMGHLQMTAVSAAEKTAFLQVTIAELQDELEVARKSSMVEMESYRNSMHAIQTELQSTTSKRSDLEEQKRKFEDEIARLRNANEAMLGNRRLLEGRLQDAEATVESLQGQMLNERTEGSRVPVLEEENVGLRGRLEEMKMEFERMESERSTLGQILEECLKLTNAAVSGSDGDLTSGYGIVRSRIQELLKNADEQHARNSLLSRSQDRIVNMIQSTAFDDSKIEQEPGSDNWFTAISELLRRMRCSSDQAPDYERAAELQQEVDDLRAQLCLAKDQALGAATDPTSRELEMRKSTQQDRLDALEFENRNLTAELRQVYEEYRDLGEQVDKVAVLRKENKRLLSTIADYERQLKEGSGRPERDDLYEGHARSGHMRHGSSHGHMRHGSSQGHVRHGSMDQLPNGGHQRSASASRGLIPRLLDWRRSAEPVVHEESPSMAGPGHARMGSIASNISIETISELEHRLTSLETSFITRTSRKSCSCGISLEDRVSLLERHLVPQCTHCHHLLSTASIPSSPITTAEGSAEVIMETVTTESLKRKIDVQERDVKKQKAF